MADHEEDFIPEVLNLQDEHFARSSSDSIDPSENFLAEDIQRTYSSYAHANAESLRRVQQRLESQLRHEQRSEKTMITKENRHKRKYAMNDTSTPRRTGWSRWSRTISTIAAVLVVAIIAGSAFLLFSVRSHSTRIGSPVQTQAITPKPPTPTPMPQVDCSQHMDSGEHAVCSKGMETALNATKTIDAQRITIFAGYADTQRIILKYTIENAGASTRQPTPSPVASGPITPILPPTTTPSRTPDEGVSLYPLTIQGGIDLGGGASSSYYDKQKQQLVTIVSFDAGKIPAGTTELHATAHFTIFSFTSAKSANDTIVINAPIPIHKEKRVATPNQTVTVNGQAVTLERVVVTPSETVLYLKYPLLAFGGNVPQSILSGQGWSSQVQSFSATTTDGTKQGTPIGGQFNADEMLMDKQGQWTFTLQTSEGTNIFKFTVPPQSQK